MAKILKFIASNFTLIDEKLVPVDKKPFDILAKTSDCPEWWSEADSNY